MLSKLTMQLQATNMDLSGSTYGPYVIVVAATMLCTACAWFILHGRYSRRLETQKVELDFRDYAIENHSIFSVTDRDGRFTRVNQAFLSAFGYSEEEVIGEKSDLLYFSDECDLTTDKVKTKSSEEEALHAATVRADVWTGEQVLRKSDGSRVITISTVIPQFDRKGVHCSNICLRTDITRQKLSETQRQLCQVLDDLQDEVFIFEVETLRIRYMNKAALSRFGWTLEDATEKQISDTDPKFNVGLFRRHTAPLFTGERDVVSIEAQHRASITEITTRVHRDGAGERLFLSVLRDITARKKSELEKMETVARVSHELRSPLTSIMGALSLVRSGKIGELSPGHRKLIDIANRNGEHLLSMVDDILNLERMNSGKMKLELACEDLGALLEDARILNSTLGRDEGINIVVKSFGDPFPTICDRKRISQVLTNLLSNAIKYSPPDSEVVVLLEKIGRSVRVSISDTGPGIPESELPKLFQSFSRVSSGDGLKRKGTGLGLAICKKIINLHNGDIKIRSVVGKGTTVYFDLPLMESEKLADISEFTELGDNAGADTQDSVHEAKAEQKEPKACQN